MADLAKVLLVSKGSSTTPKTKYKDIGDGFYAEVVYVENEGGGGGGGSGLTLAELLSAKIGTRAYNWAGISSINIAATNTVMANAVGTAKEYELSSDVDCYVLIGTAPVATTSSRYLPAGSAFTVQLAATDKIAVIRRSADGKLTILPVA